MLNLQPLIARLVDDILRAVRAASVEDLRDLASPRAADAPARARRKAAAPRTRAKPAPRRTRSARPQAQPAAREPAAGAASTLPEPPVLAEITDPDRLLSGATAVNGAPAPREPVSTELHAEPSPGTVAPAPRAAATLREGESVLTAAGPGLVIRRAKRA